MTANKDSSMQKQSKSSSPNHMDDRTRETSCYRDAVSNQDPFEDFKFSVSRSVLDAVDNDRVNCQTCGRRQSVYCCYCMIMMQGCISVPQLLLPVNVLVLQHASEQVSKSSIVGAKIVSPQNIDVVPFGEFTDVKHPQTTVVLFPGPQSVPISEYSGRIDTLILLDSPWAKAQGMVKNNAVLASLPQVSFENHYTTHFWRYNSRTDQHLSTVEALYYALKCMRPDENFDDLLWFFAHQHQLVAARMQHKYCIKSD